VDLVAFMVRTPAGRRVRDLAEVGSYEPATGYQLVPLTPPDTEVSNAKDLVSTLP
jgi:hypothetical protein